MARASSIQWLSQYLKASSRLQNNSKPDISSKIDGGVTFETASSPKSFDKETQTRCGYYYRIRMKKNEWIPFLIYYLDWLLFCQFLAPKIQICMYIKNSRYQIDNFHPKLKTQSRWTKWLCMWQSFNHKYWTPRFSSWSFLNDHSPQLTCTMTSIIRAFILFIQSKKGCNWLILDCYL